MSVIIGLWRNNCSQRCLHFQKVEKNPRIFMYSGAAPGISQDGCQVHIFGGGAPSKIFFLYVPHFTRVSMQIQLKMLLLVLPLIYCLLQRYSIHLKCSQIFNDNHTMLCCLLLLRGDANIFENVPQGPLGINLYLILLKIIFSYWVYFLNYSLHFVQFFEHFLIKSGLFRFRTGAWHLSILVTSSVI